jgi:hypothetical protein
MFYDKLFSLFLTPKLFLNAVMSFFPQRENAVMSFFTQRFCLSFIYIFFSDFSRIFLFRFWLKVYVSLMSIKKKK